MAHSEQIKKSKNEKRRGLRVRKHIRNYANRTRLSVIKSNKHLQVQLIDDEKGLTVAGVATYSKEFRNTEFNKRSKAAARKLGERIAQLGNEKGIKEVVFDRGPFKYHGILAELADAARAAGLVF
jgi:large subunit ribosomal protein L18